MRQIAKSILLRLTAEEYAHLKATADAAGLKLEPMLRQLILGVELRPRPPDEYTALLRELSAIGTEYGAQWFSAGPPLKSGHPHHPLYLRKDTPLLPFDMDAYLA